MKGILLAGGFGTRLYPLTKAMSKQALPVYDKPMIYYPLSVLMLADVKDILIISTSRDIHVFEEMLGDGSFLGINISYKIQQEPKGIAESFIIAEEFIGKDSVWLVLGDNIFYGANFIEKLKNVSKYNRGATVFGYNVYNPEEFGVVEFDENNNVISIEEKPKKPKSHYAIPGLYFYDNKVVKIAKSLTPSERGELEITDVNKYYLGIGELKIEVLGRGITWLDTGTCKGLLEAANFVSAIESKQGLYIACLEEIAYRKEYINREQLLNLSQKLINTEYGEYIKRIALE